MAVWQPHTLSTKLCILFDSGRCTVLEFARLTGIQPSFVEQLAKRDIKLDADTRHRIGTVLSVYNRKDPETRPAVNPGRLLGHLHCHKIGASGGVLIQDFANPGPTAIDDRRLSTD